MAESIRRLARATTVWCAFACDGIPRRQTRRGLLMLLGLVEIMVLGCGGSPSPPQPPAAPPVTLRLVDHAELMQEVASRRGTVVVLDCWSTSCPPCVKEFPGLVALATRHGGQVACLSLSLDYDGTGQPEDLIGPVTQFLKRMEAGPVTNLLAREDADQLYRQLDLTSVPAVFIWDQAGQLAIRYDDDLASRDLGRAFTYADVEETVAKLLADRP